MTAAPTMAPDYEREATARAAAKAGMTVEAWIRYTNKLERGARHLRIIDSEMRQTPRYRGAAA